ncbi:MAG TPA: VOC family protein [Micromonosporaceae bacterium]
MTVDCARPAELAKFWCFALGYVEAGPTAGFETWQAWLTHFNIPEEEWDDGAYIEDPDGARPGISFLKVPESKVAKNRMHLDVSVGGGRHVPIEVRWPHVTGAVDELTTAGATVMYVDESDGTPDHVVMADPEGNEFCVV